MTAPAPTDIETTTVTANQLAEAALIVVTLPNPDTDLTKIAGIIGRVSESNGFDPPPIIAVDDNTGFTMATADDLDSALVVVNAPNWGHDVYMSVREAITASLIDPAIVAGRTPPHVAILARNDSTTVEVDPNPARSDAVDTARQLAAHYQIEPHEIYET